MENNYTAGESDTRPWGTWRVLGVGDGYIVKEIIVNAGGILSLQRHQYRDEHWVITSGRGAVTLGEGRYERVPSDTVFIPRGTWHRIENIAHVPLIFAEVQVGDILDENDIERAEDNYGRLTKLR